MAHYINLKKEIKFQNNSKNGRRQKNEASIISFLTEIKLLAIIICFLFSFNTAKGQDIWFINQEVSPLYKIRNLDDWKSNIIQNDNISYYLVEKEKKENYLMKEWRTEDYKFKYKNIPIEYTILKLHYHNDNVRFINGEWFKEECFNDIDVLPIITGDIALEKALAYVGAERYIWESQEENEYFDIIDQVYLKSPPTGELTICKNYMDTVTKKLSLAYKFDIYATVPLSRSYIYVDAHTGKIVHVNSRINDINGTAITRYAGTRNIATDYYNGNYRLRDNDSNRGDGIETYNMQKGTVYADVDFTNTTNSWANFHNSNKDDAALDAHWGAMMTYDYYKNRHGRNSYDNQGSKIKNYVHYGNNYDNAFWNGSVITYGDGGNKFDALTCLDVVAHEITHAVTEYSASLVYQGESGAINESISDIIGVCVENYVGGKPFYDLWSMGEDISLQSAAMRYLYNPLLGKQPSVYKGRYWYKGSNDNGGVHTNSGVFNFWFHILSDGGFGSNQGIPISFSGIGLSQAEVLIYKCLTEYFTPNTNYENAADLTVFAAREIFGDCSYDLESVIKAWQGVGIDPSLNYDDNLVLTNTIQSGISARYFARNTIQASNVIKTNAKVSYQAGEQIILSHGFKVEEGAGFHVYIQPCIDGFLESLDKSSTIDNVISNKIDDKVLKFQNNVILYPNPTEDMVYLSFIERNHDVYVSISDILGKELFKTIVKDDKYEIDLSSFYAGMYLFQVSSNQYKQTFKIIKR